jgi:hypothetical protein
MYNVRRAELCHYLKLPACRRAGVSEKVAGSEAAVGTYPLKSSRSR